MGLDMFARTRKTAPATPVDFPSEDEDEDLAYWRKHPNLHGWMEKLYREKGGTAESFNVATVQITTEDLDRLEKDIDALPETTGFFFGVSRPEDRDLDVQFIEKARAAIESGLTVYYSSWW